MSLVHPSHKMKVIATHMAGVFVAIRLVVTVKGITESSNLMTTGLYWCIIKSLLRYGRTTLSVVSL